MDKTKPNRSRSTKADNSATAARSKLSLFSVSSDVDTETLLANAAETFSSVNNLISNLAFELEGAHRGLALGIQQMTEQGLLLVDKALEQVAPV
ncbi:DUF6124 family protein [Pseudomonas paralactis]|uniref:DUF3077 domain-containing protein n=1 Tax=Pseudomonas paralactis TaxID=1615673 RepID=A0A0R3A6D0_9PSED|nr:DUF6124 family protein [Pseudomonas paralactis]KRP68616.1 hypothetical protein TX23_25415 [Pseudomonas paralactis]